MQLLAAATFARSFRQPASMHARGKACDCLQKWPGVVPVVVAGCGVCVWVFKGSRTFAALCMHAPDAGMWFLTRASGLVGRYRSSLQQDRAASQTAHTHTHTQRQHCWERQLPDLHSS